MNDGSMKLAIYTLEVDDKDLDANKAIIETQVTIENTTEQDMQKSVRERRTPTYLQDYEVMPNDDLVHFAFLVDIELMTFEANIQDPKWINAVKEKIMSIKRNKT